MPRADRGSVWIVDLGLVGKVRPCLVLSAPTDPQDRVLVTLWLNRFCLSLLKQHPGKDSIAMKRPACGWSDEFLLQVFAGITP
jgi:hypothetical protein